MRNASWGCETVSGTIENVAEEKFECEVEKVTGNWR